MSRKDFPAKLRICLISTKFPILGRAMDHGFLWPLARALTRQGHHVTVLSWTNPNHEKLIERDGVEAHFLGEAHRGPISDFARIVTAKFIELHSRSPFHIVHSMDRAGFEIGLEKSRLGIAMVYDVEVTQMSQIFAILGMSQESLSGLLSTGINLTYKFLTSYFKQDRKLLNTADAIFVTSPVQQVALERYYLYPERKVHVVPYGIEIGDLSPREKSNELRQKLGIPENSHTVVTVSDMSVAEEIKPILRAFSRVAIKRGNARIILIGNGPQLFQVEGEALNLALGSRSHFTGAVNPQALPDYIALADIFVNLSARTSGFEPNLLEAMAQKKIIIGSEVSPISTLVEDGEDGFLIRPADVSSLAVLMNNVFAGEVDIQAIGEKARAKVVRLFDIERMARSTLRGYHQAINDCGHFRRVRSAPWATV